MYLSYSLNFTTNKFQLFSEMALVGFLYEPVSLNVNKIYFEEEQDIHIYLRISQDIHMKNQEKFKASLNGVDVGIEV